MYIFEKTPNGVVQHGPCPYCGDWGCRCGAWDDPPKDYTVDDLEAIRNHRISKETSERIELLKNNAPRRTHVVPGWPLPTRKSA
jgi:hypothetical protein